MGTFKSQYKDPYKPTSIMESRRFFFVAHLQKGLEHKGSVFSCEKISRKSQLQVLGRFGFARGGRENRTTMFGNHVELTGPYKYPNRKRMESWYFSVAWSWKYCLWHIHKYINWHCLKWYFCFWTVVPLEGIEEIWDAPTYQVASG